MPGIGNNVRNGRSDPWVIGAGWLDVRARVRAAGAYGFGSWAEHRATGPVSLGMDQPAALLARSDKAAASSADCSTHRQCHDCGVRGTGEAPPRWAALIVGLRMQSRAPSPEMKGDSSKPMSADDLLRGRCVCGDGREAQGQRP